ncbi:hypothetical protein NUU61_008394 [Penicillium alfredii]|uniref:Uncharacterized protein n=1 Tax=Penicillium alfredii TaxID=1506179 RepID=A0A9W9ESB6_9EURO|nr:uncharacterized protein NUU61_008394 [Penicillium alfredii]KAJ5087087.1 hypothetical protein NUU61_008394 [Penicillium alfredii]
MTTCISAAEAKGPPSKAPPKNVQPAYSGTGDGAQTAGAKSYKKGKCKIQIRQYQRNEMHNYLNPGEYSLEMALLDDKKNLIAYTRKTKAPPAKELPSRDHWNSLCCARRARRTAIRSVAHMAPTTGKQTNTTTLLLRFCLVLEEGIFLLALIPNPGHVPSLVLTEGFATRLAPLLVDFSTLSILSFQLDIRQ